MRDKSDYKNKASEYTVKRIEEDQFELWYEEKRLVTMSKDEAWPVMLGRIHPEEMLKRKKGETTPQRF